MSHFENREIRIVDSGDLRPTDCGNYKTKELVGRSPEGWHGGIEVSVQGGSPEIKWSEAFHSKELAEGMAKDFDSYYRMGPEPFFHGR